MSDCSDMRGKKEFGVKELPVFRVTRIALHIYYIDVNISQELNKICYIHI